MGGFAYLMGVIIITTIAYTIGEWAAMNRRARRRSFCMQREPVSDGVFAAGVAGIAPVPESFSRAVRLHLARGLGVEPNRIDAGDRLGRDLGVSLTEAMELAALLERGFDLRVRVVEVLRARTVRDLCRVLYARSEAVSDFDPPLHRDPVPLLHEGEDPNAAETPKAPEAANGTP